MNTYRKWLAGSVWLKVGTISFLLCTVLNLIWILITLAQLQTGLYYFEFYSNSLGTGSIALLFFYSLFIDALTFVLLLRISRLGKWWAIFDGVTSFIALYSVFSGKTIEYFSFSFSNAFDTSPIGTFSNIVCVFGSLCIVIAKDFSQKHVEKKWNNMFVVIDDIDIMKTPDKDGEILLSLEKGEIVRFLDQAYEEKSTKTLWYKIDYLKDTEGWCNSGKLEKYYESGA